jgi:hypothetical protein
MEQIVVTVSDAGEVQVKAECVKGQGCQALTKAIENALGRTVADVKTPDYYQQANQAATKAIGK